MKTIRILSGVLPDLENLENEAHKLMLDGYDLFASHTMRSENYVHVVLILEYYGKHESEEMISSVHARN